MLQHKVNKADELPIGVAHQNHDRLLNNKTMAIESEFLKLTVSLIEEDKLIISGEPRTTWQITLTTSSISKSIDNCYPSINASTLGPRMVLNILSLSTTIRMVILSIPPEFIHQPTV